MDYRFLGRSRLQVSTLGFGTATFTSEDKTFFKHWGNSALESARQLVNICLEAGVNFFDTANNYSEGLAEEILGQAIGKERRDQVVIATKGFFRMGPGVHDMGSSRKYLLAQCEASLRRLGTDYIDLYQLHGFDALTPLEETLDALGVLVQQGKVRYVGCSNFSGWQLMKARALAERDGKPPMISQQIYYSLLAREAESELIPLGLDQGIGTVVWSPLAYGLLAGRYRRGQPKPDDSRLVHIEPPGTIDWERLHSIVELLDAIAQERGKTVPQVALNWLLRRPSVSSLIFGARNETQLRENLGAVGWTLSEEDVRRLEAASEVPETYPYWHQHKWQAERNPLLARAYQG